MALFFCFAAQFLRGGKQHQGSALASAVQSPNHTHFWKSVKWKPCGTKARACFGWEKGSNGFRWSGNSAKRKPLNCPHCGQLWADRRQIDASPFYLLFSHRFFSHRPCASSSQAPLPAFLPKAGQTRPGSLLGAGTPTQPFKRPHSRLQGQTAGIQPVLPFSLYSVLVFDMLTSRSFLNEYESLFISIYFLHLL